MIYFLNFLKFCVFFVDLFSCVGIGRIGRVELRLVMEFKLGKERSEGKRRLRDN